MHLRNFRISDRFTRSQLPSQAVGFPSRLHRFSACMASPSSREARAPWRLAPEETVTIMDEPKRVGLRPRFWVPLLIASVLLMLYAFSKL